MIRKQKINNYVSIYGEEKVNHAKIPVPDWNHQQSNQGVLSQKNYFFSINFICKGILNDSYYSSKIKDSH